MQLGLLKTNRNFRSLWIGQLVSALGDRLTQMGILTYIMVVSGDKGSQMAWITFFSLLPFLLFGPVFGAIVDRYSRKNIMIFSDIIRAGLVALIPILWLNTHSVIVVTILIFLLGTLSALFTPAKMSIITNITDKDILLEANSLIVTTGMVATLVGTLLAGAVIKATGVDAGFYVNAFTYIVSALFIMRIMYQKAQALPLAPRRTYQALVSDIRVGIQYIRRHRLLLRLIVLSSAFSVISSFAYILILNYSSQTLHLGTLGMGVLLSCAGFGMILGSLILIYRKDKVVYKRALYLSHAIIGAALASFLFLPGMLFSSALAFCGGVGMAILTIALDTIFQRITPDDLKGKIFAARGIVGNAVFLVSLLAAGALISHVPASMLFGCIGVLSILISAGIFLSERRWGYWLLRAFLKLLMQCIFGFKVSGPEHLSKARKVILAGNHTSVIDGIALMCAYKERVYFLAADSLFGTRPWGWFARALGYIPIKRGGFNKESIQKAVQVIRSGYSIGIFPEGRITQDGRLAEGKSGVALIAQLADADIIPFAIEGAFEAWPLANKLPRRFPIEVRFGEPIDISDYPAQEELAQEVMRDIAKVKLSLERDGYLRVEPNEIVKQLINIG